MREWHGEPNQPLPSHRRLRVPVRLRGVRARRARRRRRVALPSETGRAQRLRSPPRPLRGHLRVRPVRRRRSEQPALSAGQPRARDDLADPDRLAAGSRLSRDAALGGRDAPGLLPSPAWGLRRRGRAPAYCHLHRRRRRGRPQLRPTVRLRARDRNVELFRRGLRTGAGGVECRGDDGRAHQQHAPRTGRRQELWAHHAQRGSERVRGAVLGRRGRSQHPRGGVRPDLGNRWFLARLAEGRQLPRSPVARVPGAQRADPEGPQLCAHRSDPCCSDDLAPGDAGRRAQLGLPLHVDPRLGVHAPGPVHARLRVGGLRVLRVHARGRGR
jgi:hypothetical protein